MNLKIQIIKLTISILTSINNEIAFFKIFFRIIHIKVI